MDRPLSRGRLNSDALLSRPDFSRGLLGRGPPSLARKRLKPSLSHGRVITLHHKLVFSGIKVCTTSSLALAASSSPG